MTDGSLVYGVPCQHVHILLIRFLSLITIMKLEVSCLSGVYDFGEQPLYTISTCSEMSTAGMRKRSIAKLRWCGN